MVVVAELMLLVVRIDRSPFILAVVAAGSACRRAPGRSRSSTVFSMSSTMFWSCTVMLKSNGDLNAARHDLGPRRLGRAADLHRELEGLAILGPADADRGQAGLVDLGTGPAVADQVDGRAAGDARSVAVGAVTTPRTTVSVFERRSGRR